MAPTEPLGLQTHSCCRVELYCAFRFVCVSFGSRGMCAVRIIGCCCSSLGGSAVRGVVRW